MRQLRPGGRAGPDRLLGHTIPKRLKRGHALARCIAGDQAGVDGADRSADDPVRLDAGLVERLVDPRLIGAEGAPTLEDEHNLSERGRQLADGTRPVRFYRNPG